MFRTIILISSVVAVSGVCATQSLQELAPPRSAKAFSGNPNPLQSAVNYLWPALDYGKTAGRIYYSAVCRPGESFAASFPRLHLEPPPAGKVGVAAVRDIFHQDNEVSVTEASPGVIRIRVGTVPDDVLRVRISRLVFTAEEQYNPWLAIFGLESLPQVRSAMRAIGVIPVTQVFDIPIAPPAAGSPHLPAVMREVTVDEALDLVAKTFGRVVVYEFCASRDEFEIRLVDAR